MVIFTHKYYRLQGVDSRLRGNDPRFRGGRLCGGDGFVKKKQN